MLWKDIEWDLLRWRFSKTEISQETDFMKHRFHEKQISEQISETDVMRHRFNEMRDRMKQRMKKKFIELYTNIWNSNYLMIIFRNYVVFNINNCV